MNRLLLLASLLAGCTNADLMLAAPPELAVPRLQLEASVCAPAPVEELAPYKILFVIDTSYSNSWTDPTPAGGKPRREQAVRNVINQYLDYRNVFFGIITFSDVPKRQTFGFIGTSTQADRDVLDGATANIAQAQGGTNYSDTLWNTIDFIMTDVRSVSAAEALATHYLVFWLSDGYPTVGVVDPDAIVPGVSYLTNWMGDRVAEFRFNTAFLGGGAGSVPTAEQQLAIDLLRQMAAAGQGEFTDIESGEAVDFPVDLQPVLRRFVLAGVVASNRNTLLGSPRPYADSDGDGVLDADELDLNLDPTLADTDGDGYSDGVELKVALGDTSVALREGGAAPPSPVAWNAGCDEPERDSDQDGLRDCEELLVGTNPLTADSDGDLVPDPIELAMGGAAMHDDPAFDFDLDLIPDEEEMRGHLAPQEHNGSAEVQSWSYRYLVAEQATSAAAQSCYTVVVANLAVLETLEGPERPRGDNAIELWAAFLPEDGAGAPIFRRATRTPRYLLDEDVLSPANARLELADADFVTLPRTPAAAAAP